MRPGIFSLLLPAAAAALAAPALLQGGPVPGTTSLTNPAVTFTVPDRHHVVLRRGPVTAIIVDNHAVDVPELPGHRAGYNGVASLAHARDGRNVFVPALAGLNLEHIHDGTLTVAAERFEPRKAPMVLRVVDAHTVELYQPPTPTFQLESCGRFHLLEDGTLEYTFECIPRADTFKRGYIGVFWASYLAAPEDKAIHFRGREAAAGDGPGGWLRTLSPQHGVDSTHPPAGDRRAIAYEPNFPLTLANHPSRYVHTEPWYFGVTRGLALVQMFRSADRIWFAQSPTGGGGIHPAWDFQWFATDWKVGEPRGFVMRVALTPFENHAQLETATRPHRQALNPGLRLDGPERPAAVQP
jgi:hypothetical protein